MRNMFTMASNLTTLPSIAPDLSNVTDMFGVFYGASSFNQSLNNWNVSNVTNMSHMFYGAAAFNQSLSSWNTSNVTDMWNMFSGATSFNQNINNWNVSRVTNMMAMFAGATSFNQSLSNWNVSSVRDMSNMFSNASSFNQPLNTWNVSNVTSMMQMFYNTASFNQPIGNWNVNKVSDMDRMFYSAGAFNQDISSWCVPLISSKPSLFDIAANSGFANQTAKQPKWGGCAQTPSLVGVFSRKVHGTAGTFDLQINPTGSLAPQSAITVEPRSGGTNGEFSVVFQFSSAVSSASATLAGAGSATTSVNGSEVTVRLTGVPDSTRLGITLTVNGVPNAASANIGFLLGDVDGNRAVQLSDSTAVKARSGQAVDATNFIYDVDLNGFIQPGDDSIVRTLIGGSLY